MVTPRTERGEIKDNINVNVQLEAIVPFPSSRNTIGITLHPVRKNYRIGDKYYLE